ncbi:MAG: alpha/beta fold hydrolase [Desulfobulbaceae bacterium]|nr:alpha/beta fold hydrolase [Desulfobulbaceae bacterium]
MSEKSLLFQYPFVPKSMVVNGHRMSYIDEGAGDRVVVMLHGNPTWSYLYRNLITRLKPGYRVIAPDHIGCGLSDKPEDYDYTLANHIDNVETLLKGLGIEKCVLVVHDWGGAIGMGWAGRHPDAVEGLVVLNTGAFRSKRIPLRIAACRIPRLGEWIVRALNGFAGAAVYMAVAHKMSKSIKAGFLHPYNNWQNRVAVHRFVMDIPLNNKHQSWDTLVQVENNLNKLQNKPMLICWGGKDFCFDRVFYQEWRQRFPDADAHYFSDGGHYILEDVFEEVAQLTEKFLQSSGAGELE